MLQPFGSQRVELDLATQQQEYQNNFNSLKDCKNHLEHFFLVKKKWGKKVLERRNYEVAWKMAEGSGTKP